MTENPIAEGHYNRALSFRKSFDETAVLDEISKAVAIDERPEYYLEQAWALLCLKRVEEASTCLDLVDKLIVEKPSARVNQEEFTALQKEKETQLIRFNKKQLMNSVQEDYYREALEHQKAGRASEARVAIDYALREERKPKYSLIHAWASLRIGLLEDAAHSLDLISLKDPDLDVDEYNELKALLRRFLDKQKNQENQMFEAVKSRDPKSIISAILPAASDDLILPSQRFVLKRGVAPLGKSKMGGLPHLPEGVNWPRSKNKRLLSFLCQLNLSEIDQSINWQLPKSGMLYFFYDAEKKPWGFDPADRGRWQVIYSAETTTVQPVDEELMGLERLAESEEGLIFSDYELSFQVEQTLPDKNSGCFYGAGSSAETYDAYDKALKKWYGAKPYHRLFGHPQIIQNPMEFECELASNGYNASKSHKGAKFKNMEADAKKNWILLLQVDSDDFDDMMWGDGGRLYFWIRRDDLANLNFENVWVVLQCY